MMEFDFGITDEEIRGIFASSEPNDQAFVIAFSALVSGWRAGRAEVYRRTAVAHYNGERIFAERFLEPSLN